MASARILATSGGWVDGPAEGTVRLGAMVLDALASTGKTRPRVCLLETAWGDPYESYAMGLEAFAAAGCDVTWLRVFPQPSGDPRELLGRADLVWVGGGSTANLLALWRLHGIDEAMREASAAGVVLGGVSAGSVCWHVGGPVDSFGPTLRVVTDGLALVPYGNGVHYDAEPARREEYHRAVADGMSAGYAVEDGVGLHFRGTRLARVVSSRPDGRAFLVERARGRIREDRLEADYLGDPGFAAAPPEPELRERVAA